MSPFLWLQAWTSHVATLCFSHNAPGPTALSQMWCGASVADGSGIPAHSALWATSQWRQFQAGEAEKNHSTSNHGITRAQRVTWRVTPKKRVDWICSLWREGSVSNCRSSVFVCCCHFCQSWEADEKDCFNFQKAPRVGPLREGATGAYTYGGVTDVPSLGTEWEITTVVVVAMCAAVQGEETVDFKCVHWYTLVSLQII